MKYLILVLREENQFVYLAPKGSKLIFFTPLPDGKAGFRGGVNEENRFAGTGIKYDNN